MRVCMEAKTDSNQNAYIFGETSTQRERENDRRNSERKRAGEIEPENSTRSHVMLMLVMLSNSFRLCCEHFSTLELSAY